MERGSSLKLMRRLAGGRSGPAVTTRLAKVEHSLPRRCKDASSTLVGLILVLCTMPLLAAELKQSTAVILKMGPFVDSGDFVTVEAGLTISQADIQLSKNGGAFAQTSDATPTTTYDADGFYPIPLTTTDTGTLGTIKIQITESGALPVWETHSVVTANYWDSKYSTDAREVDVIQVSGDSAAADNLELQYDTTGLAGDTFPATQVQVGNLTAGTAAINVTAESFTKSGAEPETNTYTSTHQEDGVFHIVEDVANATDAYYQFDVGGNGVPVSVTWHGYAQGQTDSYTIWAYNYDAGPAVYEQIGTIVATNGTTLRTITFDLTTSHVGTGANIGLVRFRFLSADGSAFATDRLLCSFAVVAQSIGYAEGAIWVDSTGTAGSEVYVNCVADNPCPWANAKVVNSVLGISRFHIEAGTTVTLDESADGYTFLGKSWNLALGGQSIVGMHAHGAHVSGVGVGVGADQFYENCFLDAVTHIKETHLTECGLSGTQTVSEAGDYFFDRCHSAVAGTATWVFDFGGAIGDTNLNWRNGSGGIQLEAMGDIGTDTASIEGRGQIIEGTCTGGTVAVRGLFTTSGITNLTFTDDARFGVNQLVSVYEKAAVWLDTVNGVAGTQNFENGTANNPSLTIADTLTIAASVGLTHIYVLPGSSFTLGSNVDGYHFMGNRYVVALGGQSVSGTVFEHAQVTGNDDGSNALPTAYIDCLMNSNTLAAHQFIRCGLGGDIVLTQTGMIDWIDCYSRVAGTATPSVDFGAALANTSLVLRDFSGGMKVLNVGVLGTDLMSLEGDGQLVIDATCTGGTIAIRGNFTVTDNASGAVTLSDGARYDVQQINDQVDTGLVDYDGPTNAEMEARTLVAANYFDWTVDPVATVTSVTNQVTADVTAISGDAPAADAWETMLDGTGGETLSLGQLSIVASGDDSAVNLRGSGFGVGLVARGGTTGHGMVLTGGTSAGNGLLLNHVSGTEYGLNVAGGALFDGLNAARHGITVEGGAGADGIEITGGGAGHALHLTGGPTGGNGLRAIGGSSGGDAVYVDHGFTTGKGIVVKAGVQILADEIGRHGLEIVGIGGSGADTLHIGDSVGGTSDAVEIDGDIFGATFLGSVSSVTGAVGSVVGHTPQTADHTTSIAAILADTGELQSDWVDGGRLDLILDAILADTGELQADDVPGLIAALNDLSAADLRTALGTNVSDLCLELSTTPAASPTLAQAIMVLYMDRRNKLTSTSNLLQIHNDAGTAVMEAPLSDDGTTFTKGELVDP